MRRSLYGTHSRTRDLYHQNNQPSATYFGEVDLREELDGLFFSPNGIRHGRLVVLRTMRRDATGKKIDCTCLDPLTKEASMGCAYCYGEGYLFDEGWIWCHSMHAAGNAGLVSKRRYVQPGAVRVDYKVFYFRYDTVIKYGDKIIDMKLDEEGDVVVPYVRETIYSPQTINTYRSDNGRIEYIAAACREEDAIRLDR